MKKQVERSIRIAQLIRDINELNTEIETHRRLWNDGKMSWEDYYAQRFGSSIEPLCAELEMLIKEVANTL